MIRRLSTLLLFLLLVTTKIDNVSVATRFDSSVLRIVDEFQGNVLVRGNAPLNDSGKFDPDMLRTSIELGLKKPIHKLVVVSLLNARARDEAPVLEEIRQTATRDDSPFVEFVHIAISGSWLSLILPSWFGLIDATGGAWDLSSRLLYMMQTFNPGTTTAIYVHCMRGKDRTGLVAGIYGMRYQNKSLKQVQEANWLIAGRKLQYLEEQSLVAGGTRLQQQQESSKMSSVETITDSSEPEL